MVPRLVMAHLRFHRSREHFAAMAVVPEHVEARARRRQEHYVAFTACRARKLHRFFHGVGALNIDARTLDRTRDLLAIARG